jgi:methyl-accepting chemotaxis protein
MRVAGEPEAVAGVSPAWEPLAGWVRAAREAGAHLFRGQDARALPAEAVSGSRAGARAGTLGQVIADLEHLNRNTEQDFLRIGGKLADFIATVKLISTELNSLVDLISEESGQRSAQTLTSVLDRSTEMTARAEQNRDLLAGMRQEVCRLKETLSGFTDTVSSFRTLSVLTRIETARLGKAGAGFGNLAEDVRLLATDVEARVEHALGSTALLLPPLEEAMQIVARLERGQTKDLPVVISGVLTNLAAFRDKQRQVRESSMRLGARYDSISTAFKQLIVSIQFHDITRQQVQHVIDTLRQVFSGSPDGDGSASRASAAATVLLQSRQLADAGEKFAASVASVARNMDEIAQHVLEMAGESRLLSGLSEDETHGFLLEMEKISTAILASLSHCSSTQGSIYAASGDLAGLIRRTHGPVEEIRAIENQLRRMALNAAVRAAHLGAAGNVLGVLAASMQEFASECKARSRCLTETLGAMSAAAIRLSGQDGSQPGGSSCAPDGDLEPMRAAVAELHSSSERSFAQIARILSCGERLSHDLAATRRSFTVGDVFAKAIVRARTMLEEIGGQAWSGLPDNGVAAPERDLADLARIYTMRAEREVHEAVAREVAGATPASAETVLVESPPGEGGEFGVNVEFF